MLRIAIQNELTDRQRACLYALLHGGEHDAEIAERLHDARQSQAHQKSRERLRRRSAIRRRG
ncbi:MAG: hypothetical protein ACLS69_10150 [Butyricicoccus sp.]